MKESTLCKIVKKTELVPGLFDLELHAPEASREAVPGQFVHIMCPSYENIFLRRPISIRDAKDDCLRIVFEVRGKGTYSLSRCGIGDEVDVLAPLGRGFEISRELYQKPLIVGGGIGIFPLYALAKQYEGSAEVFFGFRDKSRIVMEEEFQAVSKQLTVMTDDGSKGNKGFATAPLEEKLKVGEGDIIYACGPMPMLKIVKRLAEQYQVKAQLSLEQRMGCGIGACLTCSCETVFPGTWKYQRVCLNGPVFWADEVTLHD